MPLYRVSPTQPPYQPQPLRRPPALGTPVPSFTITPSAVPKSHGGNITLTLTGSNTSWSNATTVFTPSGVTGVTKVSQAVTSSTAATVVVTTDSTHTGTLTITESVTGSAATTTTVATATLAISPTTGTVGTTPTLTLAGANTVWTQETAAGLFTVLGGTGDSVGTPTITSDTDGTAILTVGSAAGTLTVTDNSTGATAAFTASAVSGSIAVITPETWHTYRKNGSNQITIHTTGTYTLGPTAKNMECSLAGSAYVALSTVPSGGNFAGDVTFTIHPGTPDVQGDFVIRFRDATTINQTVQHVGGGAIVGLGGQSNDVGVISTFQSYANGAGLKATAWVAGNTSFSGPSFWGEGNDPLVNGWVLGSPWPLLGTHLMNYLGTPVAFVQTGKGGVPVVWWWTKYRPDTGVSGTGNVPPSPLNGYAEIINQFSNAATGGVDVLIFYEGEQDVDNSQPQAVFRNALGTFGQQIAADVAGAPKLALVEFGHNGDASGIPRSVADGIKNAIRDVAHGTGENALPGIIQVNDFSNDLHILTAAEAQKVADRAAALLISEVFGGTPGAGTGPRATSCQYNAARTTVSVTFDKVLKTGLTLDTSLWGVTGNGIAATVSGVAYHATDTRAVTLTLSSAAALPIVVSFAQGGSTAGKVWPTGPDFTLPGGAGTINLPAEMFAGMAAAAEGASTGGSGGVPLIGGGLVR